MKAFLFSILGLLLIAVISWGDIIYVPGDYHTIQAAVNAALPGDTVQVAPGTFGIVSVLSKHDICLFGSGMMGPGRTTITNGLTHGIILYNCSRFEIRGFEITNVYHGICLGNCSYIEISETYAHNNAIGNATGAAFLSNNNIWYHHNVVSGNILGGIWMNGTTNLKLINNTISYNYNNGVLLLSYDADL